ncbi:nuclear transport factor 2 family protein [Chondromyces apiculatus]|uniref:SnoaL-like domain-containing protein n=1 Tax=Chondromyces apiculatus DSM 436 TaxID=1192034 RepID=A0A017SV60_9BACT|nr:nuclear transport factor 2 family protein [Chondromyces apiculatus]EYF00485.1 Hypothetical protein CAP_0575 [Chondromyces apiculatus DSM 436]
MNTSIIDIVNASQDALLAGNVERYLALFAEDVISAGPVSPPSRGRAALKHHVEALLAGFSSIRFVERQVFAVGRSAALRYSLEAESHSGKPVRLTGVDVFEIDEDSRIHRVTSYFDPAALTSPG